MSKYLLFFIPALFVSCVENNPNLNQVGIDVFDEDNQVYVDQIDLSYEDTVYVPIYSDIYNETKENRVLLTATMSVRNTSLRDSIYIRDIEYYNTKGKMVRSYLDKILVLQPMESIEYVIERSDASGGSGANFLVKWGARNSGLNPMFQSVMVGTSGQHGISFLTNGISVSQRGGQKENSLTE